MARSVSASAIAGHNNDGRWEKLLQAVLHFDRLAVDLKHLAVWVAPTTLALPKLPALYKETKYEDITTAACSYAKIQNIWPPWQVSP